MGSIYDEIFPTFLTPAPDGLYLLGDVEAWFNRYHGKRLDNDMVAKVNGSCNVKRMSICSARSLALRAKVARTTRIGGTQAARNVG